MINSDRKPVAWLDSSRKIAKSPAARYIGGLSAGSRRTIHQSLATIAALLAGDDADPIRFRWEDLRRQQTLAIRSELQDRYAPATANKMLSALRCVLRTARSMELMSERDYQTTASIEMIEPAKPLPKHTVTQKEVARLFKACTRDDKAASRRDAAALAIFLSSGLRRTESIDLNVADYDPRSGQLHIRGERPEYDRVVELGKPAIAAVNHWLAVRSDEDGPLLLPVNRGGLIQFRRMTSQAAYDLIGRIAKRANLPGVTARDLRRAYVISLIRSGMTVGEVQYRVGHASWVTTAMYQQLAQAIEDEGYDITKLPYTKPKRSTP